MFRHGLSIASASMTPNYSSMFPFFVNQQRQEKEKRKEQKSRARLVV
jgi:hypothetical protein